MKSLFGALCCLLTAVSCINTNRPLDADERHRVDSLSAAAIGVARRDLDSLCKVQHATLLPHLTDSIKKVRLQQIPQQIRQIPK